MLMVLVEKKIPSLSYAKTIWIDIYSFSLFLMPTTMLAPTTMPEGKKKIFIKIE